MCFLNRESSIFILLGIVSTELFAQVSYPSCAPMESSWDNIELITQLKTEEDEITFTVSMLGNSLPHYYGFAFTNNKQRKLPTAKEPAQFYQYFNHKTLLALQEKSANKEGDRVYRFKPLKQGDWMIYLIASLKPIDFLEQNQLQIRPVIETVRGGTVIGGNTLDLVDPIDYKVCQITEE